MTKCILFFMTILVSSSGWGSLYLRVQGTVEKVNLKKDQVFVQTQFGTRLISPSKIQSAKNRKEVKNLVGGQKVDMNVAPQAMTQVKMAKLGGR